MAARRSAKAQKLGDLAGQPDAKATLDWQLFLKSAQPVLKLLQDDLRARAKTSAAVAEVLTARHAAERDNKRTADSFVEWQDHFIEQVAAAWLLSCVFVRTLEDRGLLGHNRLAGPGAADSLKLFLDLAPSLNERDYLLTLFRELTRFPSTKELFDSRHNPVWLLTPSADGAKALVQLFQQPRADVPAFRFGQSDTGFLGWLYQDLDAGVRERFALLQTPRFIESFILDRTLEPAIEKFGLDDTTLIDPTCGSGHFLLGAFERLFDHRLRREPGLSTREAAKKALDAVFGSDINPYAVGIARFRLTLAFLDKAGFTNLATAPALPLHVVVGDSLLHNPHVSQPDFADLAPSTKGWRGEEFALEDEAAARTVLHRKYAAVVGNPPYIQMKDAAKKETYKKFYASAYREYSLGVPFTERFFQLGRHGGRVGMITANSFMKREFGKKLIEEVLPTVDLDLVINTSGAYIPGHGTPTVLLFGSAEPPRGTHVTTVLASRGEPSTPADPEQGLVWRSIAAHWDEPGFENEYISAAAIERISFAKHPWSLGGGGAVELKDLLELRSSGRLASVTDSIGFMCITKQDDVFSQPRGVFERARLGGDWIGEFVIGENVRDWSIAKDLNVFFPYEQDGSLRNLPPQDPAYCFLWPFRTALEARAVFGGATFRTAGKRWFEYGQIPKDRITGPAITFASIATHNHFVLDRGGKVFKQTAPIIKLATGSSEEDHLALLAYLNSSTACFWMKQVCFPKGGSGIGRGIQDEEWESRFEFDATKLASLPLPAPTPQHRELARALDQNAAARAALSPATRLANWLVDGDARDPALPQARAQRDALLAQAVALQERLDWQIYTDFGLLTTVEADELQRSKAFNSIEPGARAFESALIQSEPTTAWFTRNRYAIPQQPEPSPSVAAHTKALRQNKSLGLVERPEYKRRWGVPAHEAEERSAACALLADATEADFGANTVTPRHLDQRVRGRFRQKIDVLLELAQRPLSDVLSESAVPFLASLRFTELGLDRHAEWERTWDLQRREDAGETLDKIAVPPKYGQSDYRSTASWQLRGPLDVPKERFISYPACESDQDGEPVYGWGGWDHEQRARALATLYVNRRDEESWPKERLTPMLAGLLELLPWVTQWHGTPSDDYAGVSPGAYYEGFLDDECRKYGLTRDDLRAWRPAERKRAAAKAATSATETGTWRLADTLVLDDGAYYAVAAAVLLRAQLPWQASAAGAIALDGGSALRFIDAAATKVWKRNLGADAKNDIDAAVLFAAAHKAVDDLKRDGAIHEGADGTLAATGKLTLATVRPTALVERVRFVLEHVMPHVESEAQVLSMPTAKPAKVKNAKRQAV